MTPDPEPSAFGRRAARRRAALVAALALGVSSCAGSGTSTPRRDDRPAIRPTAERPPSPRAGDEPSPPAAAAAATAPATAPDLPVSSRETPAAAGEDLAAERARLAEAAERLDLLRREVADLPLTDAEWRELGPQFEGVAAWWRQLRAEFDAGHLPPDDRRAALAQRIDQTRQRVQALLGPDRAIQLAALRRTPRGVGRQWAARLRWSLDAVGVTREQSSRVDAVVTALREGVDALPAADPPDPASATAVREEVQRLIERTHAGLSAVLAEPQVRELVQRVPTLVRTAPAR